MKINVNGVTREMSRKEEAAYLAEMERMAAEIPAPAPTPEERMDAMEEALLELGLLLGGGL